MTTWMLPLLVKASVVLVAAALMALVMRRASASARHAMWTVSLVALLLLPVLAYVVPRWEVAVLPPVPPQLVPGPVTDDVTVSPAVASAIGTEPSLPNSEPAMEEDAAAPRPSAEPKVPFDWSLAVLTAWWLGACGGVLHLGLGTTLIALKTRRAVPVSEEAWLSSLADASSRIGLGRPVALRMSEHIAIPMVWGVWRPVILIPTDADSWPAERRRAFLLHELAHVARHDCVTQTLAAVAHSLYWPHPLVWWAVSRMRREAERACDDRVLTAGTHAPAYAHHLLEAARGLGDAPRTFSPASAVVERTNLGDRLLALLDDRLSRRAVSVRAAAIAGIGALVVTSVIAAVQPVARAAVAAVVNAAVAPSAAPEPASAPAAPRPLATAQPETVLIGIVNGPGGKPVKDALVLAWDPQRSGDPPLSARTNEKGEFKIVVPGPAAYAVRVEATPYVPHVIDKIGTRGLIAVTLRKGATITGSVRDAATKRPIAGARVTARGERDVRRAPYLPSEPDAGTTVATTDKEGRYRLEGLATGSHRLNAVGAGYGTGERRALSGATDADLFLDPGVALAGVVNGPDAKPVAAASVHAICRASNCTAPPRASSDKAGRFEILGVEPGAYDVVARHPDWAPAYVPDINVRLGAMPPLEIRLEKGYRVTGRLVGTDERAVRGTVSLQASGGEGVRVTLVRGQSGADGRFTLQGVPPGTHSLDVFPVGYPPLRTEVAAGGKETHVEMGDVKVEAGLVIRGKVRNAKGVPVKGAAISAFGGNLSMLRAESEADGSFALAGGEKRVYHLRVRAEGYADVSDVEAEPGTAPVEIVLPLEGKITGSVVDASGLPAAECLAVAHSGERRTHNAAVPIGNTATASAGGRFEITGLRAGTFIVQIQAAQHVDKTVSDVKVTAGDTTDIGKVTLSPGGVVRGVVVDGADAPIAGARVDVTPRLISFRGPQGSDVTTDAGGRFELGGLSVGPSEVRAHHKRFAPSVPVEVNVDSATPAEVQLILLRGGTVEGTARGSDGRPLADAMVTVRSLDGGAASPGHVAVRGDGTFTIEHVTPGKARVVLGVAGRGRGRYDGVLFRDVDVRDGAATHVDLVLNDIRVSGRVTRGGQPMANHRVFLSDKSGMTMMFRPGASVPPGTAGPARKEAVTGPNGEYELLVGGPGIYSVRVAPQERGRMATRDMPDVTVPEGAQFVHHIELPDWAVSGVVVDKDSGKPIEDARVEAIPPPESGANYAQMRTAADGRFRLAVDPGSYRLRVAAVRYMPYDQTMTLGGGSVDRTVEMVRGSLLKGHVRTSSGEGVNRAHVIALWPGAATAAVSWSLVDGAFELDGVAAGSFDLFAGHPAGFALQAGVSLGGDPVKLTMAPGAKTRFRFKDENGAPMVETECAVQLIRWNGTRVGIENNGSYHNRRTTDSEGGLDIVLPIGVVDVVGGCKRMLVRGEAQVTVDPQMPEATLVVKPRS